MIRKLFCLVFTFMVVGLIGPVAAQEVDMEIGFAVQPPVLDGQVDEIWDGASTQYFVPLADPADGSGIWKVLYDAENLYVLVDVTDDSLQNDSASSWQDDSVEIYFDGGNTKVNTPLSGDDHQYTFGWTADEIQGTNITGATEGMEQAQVTTDTGWRIEIKLPWLSIQGVAPQAGDLIGIDCYYNDDDDGGDSRENKMLGFSALEGWNDASQWGTAILAAIPEPEPVDPGSDGLAAAYVFETDAADSSGNGLDGTLLGDAHAADGVLVLDGEDDAVAIPGIGDGLTEFTFSMKVYPTVDLVPLQFSGGINTDSWTGGVHFKLNYGNVNVGVNGLAGGDVVGTSIIEPDKWTHLALTVSPTEVAVYVNGEKEGSRTGETVPAVNVGAATIGAWNNSGTDVQREMTGMMDDVLIYNRALSEAEIRYLAGERAPILVDPNSDLAAAAATVQPGGTIEFVEGTYYITSQIEIKDGVTYRGAGPGLTIIDGNGTTRAFVAWGDRFFNEDNENANDSGPKNWVMEGMTIQNCVADANDRFSYTGAAFSLKTNFEALDADISGGLDPAEADAQVGGIRLAGPDANEPTEDDDLHRFAHIDTDASGAISMAELDAQLLLREDEFGDQAGDGGAITIDNGAVGTIRNCEFLNNHTPALGSGDDGGAVNITSLSVVTINDCLFDGNYAVSAESVAVDGSDGDGGHIKVQGGSASAVTPGTTLIANRCKFLNGNASDDGGAIQSSAVGNVIRLDSCRFEANTSWDNGNVCQFSSNAQNEVTVTNCIFANNVTKADNGPDRMIETNRNSKFINCTFVGNNQNDEDMIYNNANTQDTDGDGVDDEMADVTQVINCIFVNNVVGNGDDILGSRDDIFTIRATNCLFFGNTLQNGKAADNTQRPAEETGSVTDDPLLDAEYVPGAGSPAIDAGVDPATVGITLMTDYNGVARPQGAAYDIGAFEVVAAPPAE